jgi:hypothetical protein
VVPEKVNVAGIEYSIKYLKGLEQKHGLMGLVRYGPAEIEIDETLSGERKEQVFVHELLHACFFEAGYTEHDEDTVNRVSAVLYQVLKNNTINFSGNNAETEPIDIRNLY